jgi:hypothetical protein
MQWHAWFSRIGRILSVGWLFCASHVQYMVLYGDASEMCGACGPKCAAMGRIFEGLCLIHKLLPTSGCFSSQCRYNIRLEGCFPRTSDGDAAELDAQIIALLLGALSPLAHFAHGPCPPPSHQTERSASCPDEEMLADSFFELAFRSKARLCLLLGFEWPMALTGLCLPWSRGPPWRTCRPIPTCPGVAWHFVALCLFFAPSQVRGCG